jgi:hypothetical protein
VQNHRQLVAVVYFRGINELNVVVEPDRERVLEDHCQIGAERIIYTWNRTFEELRIWKRARVVNCSLALALRAYNCRRTRGSERPGHAKSMQAQQYAVPQQGLMDFGLPLSIHAANAEMK